MQSTPYINIELKPQYSLVQSQWLRAVDSTEYRKSLTKTYDTIKNNRVVCWLADATRLSTPNMIDQKWTANLVGERMSATALRKIALVLPDDLFLEVVAEKIGERIIRMTNNKIQIGYFNSHASALEWLIRLKDSEGLFRDDIPINQEKRNITW